MKINFDKKDRILIVHISGDIDHHTSEEIRNKTDREIEKLNTKDIIFDFSSVTFMDSSGIGMIIGRYKNIEIKGGKAVVININEDMKRIFEISGLFKIIKYYDNIEQAFKDLTNRG